MPCMPDRPIDPKPEARSLYSETCTFILVSYVYASRHHLTLRTSHRRTAPSPATISARDAPASGFETDRRDGRFVEPEAREHPEEHICGQCTLPHDAHFPRPPYAHHRSLISTCTLSLDKYAPIAQGGSRGLRIWDSGLWFRGFVGLSKGLGLLQTLERCVLKQLFAGRYLGHESLVRTQV